MFLHRDIFDSFLEKLTAKTQTLKIGDPVDEASDVGCTPVAAGIDGGTNHYFRATGLMLDARSGRTGFG